MRYVVTLREVTVRKFIIESEKTDRDELEQVFWEEDMEAYEQPGGDAYCDELHSEVESIEPLEQEKA